MKKFIFTPRKILKKGYTAYTSKAQFRGILWLDIIKVSVVLIGILLSTFFYLKYVSLSSTEGYFLRQANNKLNVAKFNYEILKIKILEYEKETRDKLTFPTKENKIETIEIQRNE